MKIRTRNEGVLDDLDGKIIIALQENARLSMAALGRKLGLSAPAARERVRRLEERKVIRAYRAEIEFGLVGLEVQALVRIKASGHGLDKATRTLCAFPEVFECHRATGGDCFVLRVAVPDIKALEEFLDRIAPFGELTTSIILSTPLKQKAVSAGLLSITTARSRQ